MFSFRPLFGPGLLQLHLTPRGCFSVRHIVRVDSERREVRIRYHRRRHIDHCVIVQVDLLCLSRQLAEILQQRLVELRVRRRLKLAINCFRSIGISPSLGRKLQIIRFHEEKLDISIKHAKQVVNMRLRDRYSCAISPRSIQCFEVPNPIKDLPQIYDPELCLETAAIVRHIAHTAYPVVRWRRIANRSHVRIQESNFQATGEHGPISRPVWCMMSPQITFARRGLQTCIPRSLNN